MGIKSCLYYYLFRNKQLVDTDPLTRFLVVRNDRIGDVCVTLPLINLIRKWKPDCELTVLTGEYTADILKDNPDITRIVVQQKDDTPETVAQKLENYDLLLSPCSTSFNARLAKKVKAIYKVGFAYKLYNMMSFNRFVYTRRSKPPVHESEFCFGFLETLGANIERFKDEAVKDANIYVDRDDELAAYEYASNLGLDRGKQMIAIHPGDNKSAFNCSIEKYKEIGERLKDKYNTVFVFGPSETDLIDKFSDEQKDAFGFIKGDMNLKQLAAFLKRCDCLVSGSTGPMHMAGVMNIPTVSLFSNEPAHDPLKWQPLNDKRMIINPRGSGAESMNTIDPGEVVKAVEVIAEQK